MSNNKWCLKCLYVGFVEELGRSCKTAGAESLSLLSLMRTGRHNLLLCLNAENIQGGPIKTAHF